MRRAATTSRSGRRGRHGCRSLAPVPPGCRLVIGDYAIEEVFTVRPRAIEKLILREGWESVEKLRSLEKRARGGPMPIELRPVSFLDQMGSHQGAALLVRGQPELDWGSLATRQVALVLALDGVEDPHNLGAVLRSSWLMGAQAVLLPEDRSVGLTPTVHKVASGGAEHVPCMKVGPFKASFDELRRQGFWIFGLSHQGKKPCASPQNLFDLRLPNKVLWVLGSEENGLRSTTESACDELVSIPQSEARASYNISVAAGIALAEFWRQCQAPLRKTKETTSSNL